MISRQFKAFDKINTRMVDDWKAKIIIKINTFTHTQREREMQNDLVELKMNQENYHFQSMNKR